MLASVAPTTKKAYESIFFEFVRSFDELELNFKTISINHVLSFLKKFVGRSKSRVRTGVAALKFFLRVYNRLDLVNNPLIDMFSKGAQNMAPLPREKVVIWDPAQVLNAMRNRPLPSSFLVIAGEAVLLLLLATGWRVDDVWKVGSEVQFFDDSARFKFVEKRKCKIKGKHTVSQTVRKFLECDRICPIEAVQRFLNCAVRVRKDDVFLFVSQTGHRASKDSLRRWVQAELAKAGIIASAGSCRSASTSSAAERQVSIDSILKSAGWSSENTFRRFYHRTVIHDDAPINLFEGV